MSSNTRILFVTNSERGQCTVFFATAAALLRNFPDADVHFASFPVIKQDVVAISDDASRTNPNVRPITFHTIAGKSHSEAATIDILAFISSLLRPLSLTTTLKNINDMFGLLFGWNGPDFMEVYDSINSIIKTVVPDLIMVDALMSPAITAAHHSDSPYSFLSPNCFLDFERVLQPHLSVLWKYPAMMSGYDYPVPWHLRPFNALIVLYVVSRVLQEPKLWATKKFVLEKTGKPMKTIMDWNRQSPKSVKMFLSTLPELDFPLERHLNFVPCGPIVVDAGPISESELGDWLANGPTIYANLGSLYVLTEDQAGKLAMALNLVLDEMDRRRPNDAPMQVLWKFKKAGDFDATSPKCKINVAFGNKIANGRVKILNWLHTPPLSILRTGNIVCSVHHGGANSFNEAIVAGVPHFVLPAWTDCYDYANKVEYLGVGRKDRGKLRPDFEATELSAQMLSVIDGNESADMRAKAVALAKLCHQNGNGAEIAAQGIWDLALERTLSVSQENS